MQIIDDATVRAILEPDRVLRLMELALVAGARGKAINPVRTVVQSGDGPLAGWFATMPASLDLGPAGEREFGVGTVLGAKLVTAFPANRERGLPTHRALIAAIDPVTGEISALVEGDAVTELRTAAVSTLAVRRFGRRLPGRLAVLGCGVQGRAHVEALVAAGLVSSLAVWSRTASNAQAFALRARAAGIPAEAFSTPRETLTHADIVVTATNASEPLFSLEDLPESSIVAAVGACVPTRREVPALVMARSALYVDDRAAAECEAGDLLLARRDLGIAIEPQATLGEMLADPARAVPREAPFIVFESLGLGLEDVACAAAVAAQAGRARA